MAPNFCDAHGPLMRTLGNLEQGQEDLCGKVDDMKEAFTKLTTELQDLKLREAKETTKANILYWAINGGFITAVSAGMHFLMKRLGGE